jgi:hypothetical protein
MAHAHARPRPPTSSALSLVRLLSPLVLAVAFSPSALSAQARSSHFETLDLSLTLLADVNHGTLHRYWSPGPAFAVGAALPFYLGTVETGLQYAHPEALRGDVPGFRSLFIYAGWGGGLDLDSRLRAGGGFRVGVQGMRFDGDSLPAFRRSESELGIAARAGVRWTPAGSWFMEASVTYQSILTHHRMEQVFLSAGLGRRFRTPAWLRDFLD